MLAFGKFKEWILGNDVEEDDDFIDDNMEVVSSNSYTDDEPEDTGRDSFSKRNRVVNINATTQLKVVLVKPERFEDAGMVADHINNKRTVVMNLESASKEDYRRLLDFLSGVAYANQSTLKQVANRTFIVTPRNVDIMGDLLDELESNGAFF